MSESGLRVLGALGEQFQRLGEPAPRRRDRVSRTAIIAVALVLLLAGVATAAVLISQGSSLPAPAAIDLQASGVPLASTARLAGLDVPDPDAAEAPWDIRLSRTAAGETCAAVGQVLDGKFGIVGLDHVFRALPLGGVDACGVRGGNGYVMTGAKVFVGATTQQARTVVNGVAGPGTRSVSVAGPGGVRRLKLGPDGTFVTVYQGYAEEVRPRVTIVSADGRSRTVALAQSVAYEVSDPSGLYSWQVSGGPDLTRGAFPDENCAQATELVGRNNPSQIDSSLTPIICGRLGSQPLFVTFRRFVPGSGARGGFPWGNTPSRTLVYGATAPRVASLTLTGAGAARTLPIDPHGGVFLAVLDGHLDPRTLTLTARLADGRSLTYTRSTVLYAEGSSRPVREAPVPAYREPAPAKFTAPPPAEIPLAGTTRETLRAPDPAGGPEWALRSWQGRPNPRANFGGRPPARFICIQVGVLVGGALIAATPERTPLSVGGEVQAGIGGCNAPSDLTRFGPGGEAVSYVDDPFAYSPRPLRTVVSGMLRLDASDPVLLGAGAPRPLRLDPNRAFMAVLPGRYWDAPLHITARVKGRTLTGSAVVGPGQAELEVPQARAPDPNCGAPWGFAASASRTTATGRIVQGRLASISGSEGMLRNGPEEWGGGGPTPGFEPHHPVQFDAHGSPEYTGPGQPQPVLTRVQVQRRTLPGRTIVTGVAEPDVVSVTITTPTDVRTLRPSGRHDVLILVYDGQFFRGSLTATVRLRSRREVTYPILGGPAEAGASPPPTPPLSVRLHRDERTLAGMRKQIASGGRGAGGAPVPTLRIGVHDIEGIVAAERARLAYEQAHPGVLPRA
jgi:hypothetical protein